MRYAQKLKYIWTKRWIAVKLWALCIECIGWYGGEPYGYEYDWNAHVRLNWVDWNGNTFCWYLVIPFRNISHQLSLQYYGELIIASKRWNECMLFKCTLVKGAVQPLTLYYWMKILRFAGKKVWFKIRNRQWNTLKPWSWASSVFKTATMKIIKLCVSDSSQIDKLYSIEM